MKKLVTLFLAIMMTMICVVALASEPGDTVSVPIRLSNKDGCYVKISISFESSVFEFVSINADLGLATGGSGRATVSITSLDVIPSGQVATLNLKIKDDAPVGSYSVSASVSECWDFDGEEGKASASAGGSTQVHSVSTVTTKEATCTEVGEKASMCTVCKKVFSTEEIPALGHDDSGEWVTTYEPTCIEDGEKVLKCIRCQVQIDSESINALGHDASGEWTTTKQPTCTEEGEEVLKCVRCNEVIDNKTINATGHFESETWTTTKQPTCTEDGERVLKCTVCGEQLDSEPIDALGHDDTGSWTVTKKPTCTEEGEEILKCKVCGEQIDSKPIDALGHDETGAWTVTKQPTCTEEGEEILECVCCGEQIDSKTIDALGHDDGKWVVTVEATCSSDGEKVLKCTRCSEVLDTEVIPMSEVPHTAGKMTVVTKATCLEEGLKEQHCTKCGILLNSEIIPALGHDKGRWVIITRATRETEGLKELHCTRCNELLDSAIIPMVTYRYYENNACVYGLRFADYVDGLNTWFTFMPIDLSVDGTQTYDLIAGKMHKIGTVTATIADGKMNVTYALCSKQIEVNSELLAFFGSISEVISLDDNSLTSYAFGEDINIADTFGEDTKVLLYVHLETLYSDEISALEDYSFNAKANQKLMEELAEVMD